ncbi:MAG: SDR family NAD(P)-dependent oxidoreductase [Patescibacteria group bacterium]|nr:SDR family NAD(P)-dependent oxidoreductase [Patescibacteria group bacterium]MCL5095164.1 SDR family NAD(P)-dependent oxidoreductase [Patescibacteria group bacterium]
MKMIKSGLLGKTILVTGGTGFIGGHLVEKLLELGAKVIVVDIELKKNSTFSLNKLKDKVKLELTDIRNEKKILELFRRYQPEYVFHLAAYSTVTASLEKPREAFETNVMGTINLLEAARLSSFVKGIIVASSDKAYGKLIKGKYWEEDALKGDHPYDVSKSCEDLISLAYYKTYGLPVAVTRFGNVYGEGDLHSDRIIPGICTAVIKNKPLELRSNGKYVRDYLYVKDVVCGYLFLLQNFAKIKGEAFNFSSSETLSVLALVKKIEGILKVKIPYKILNTAKNEIPYQHLNDRKIRNLGWRTNYAFKEGIKETFLWYQKHLKDEKR